MTSASTMRTVFVGPGCNNSCVFCAQGDLRSNTPDPTDEEVSRRLAEALASGDSGGAVAFIGGEPTLRAGLPRWIAEAKRRGASRIVVQTNGRKLGAGKLAGKLARAGLDGLDISLHGSTPSMHDYHTGEIGSFEQTLAGIRSARKAGLELGLTTVVTRSNFRHLDDIVRLAASVGAAALHLEPARAFGRALQSWERVVPNDEVVKAGLEQAARLARSLGLLAPEAARLFAGLGPVEEAASPPAASAVPVPAARTKPAPGAREVRSPSRKTGDALKEIFPDLFQAGGKP